MTKVVQMILGLKGGLIGCLARLVRSSQSNRPKDSELRKVYSSSRRHTRAWRKMHGRYLDAVAKQFQIDVFPLWACVVNFPSLVKSDLLVVLSRRTLRLRRKGRTGYISSFLFSFNSRKSKRHNHSSR